MRCTVHGDRAPRHPAPHPAGSRNLLLISSLILFLVPLSACDSPLKPGETPALSARNLSAHMNYLAGDGLYGRGSGTEHELQAAEYIRSRLVEYNLQPGAPDYLQSFSMQALPFITAVGAAQPVGMPQFTETDSSQNVLAVLPGEGTLAGQWVIVGAHYDHLGIGAPMRSDAIYNGADDNASGTALLLEIARIISVAASGISGEDGRRSIMFQAYGAEEMGMLGSFFFCLNPTVSMDSIVAMINLDMVGRLRENGLALIGASSSAEWSALLDVANRDALNFYYEDRVLNRSDQYCFYQAKKPVLFFHTGEHAEYHTPSDEVGLIDRDGMLRVGDLATAVLLDLVTRPDPLAFTTSTVLPDAPVGASTARAARRSGGSAPW
jgi:hypothetical protein